MSTTKTKTPMVDLIIRSGDVRFARSKSAEMVAHVNAQFTGGEVIRKVIIRRDKSIGTGLTIETSIAGRSSKGMR